MTSYTDILALIPTSGTKTSDLDDNRATLKLTQAQALVAQGVSFASGDAIEVSDVATTIEALAASEISDLKSLGVDNVLATDRVVSLGVSLTVSACVSLFPMS